MKKKSARHGGLFEVCDKFGLKPRVVSGCKGFSFTITWQYRPWLSRRNQLKMTWTCLMCFDRSPNNIGRCWVKTECLDRLTRRILVNINYAFFKTAMMARPSWTMCVAVGKIENILYLLLVLRWCIMDGSLATQGKTRYIFSLLFTTSKREGKVWKLNMICNHALTCHAVVNKVFLRRPRSHPFWNFNERDTFLWYNHGLEIT